MGTYYASRDVVSVPNRLQEGSEPHVLADEAVPTVGSPRTRRAPSDAIDAPVRENTPTKQRIDRALNVPPPQQAASGFHSKRITNEGIA